MIMPIKLIHKANPFKVISVVFIVILSLSLSACQSREPVTADVFQVKLEESGHTVIDITDQYSEFTHVLKALGSETNDVHIEFFEIDNKDNATAMFNGNQATIEAYKGSSSSTSSVSTGSYQKYSLTTSDNHYVVIRVDTTLVYANCPKSEREALDSIIEGLGY